MVINDIDRLDGAFTKLYNKKLDKNNIPDNTDSFTYLEDLSKDPTKKIIQIDGRYSMIELKLMIETILELRDGKKEWDTQN